MDRPVTVKAGGEIESRLVERCPSQGLSRFAAASTQDGPADAHLERLTLVRVDADAGKCGVVGADRLGSGAPPEESEGVRATEPFTERLS
jgi:hypothetical protein